MTNSLKKFPFFILGLVFISSCLSPAEKVSGTYNGLYTNNALILSNTNATVTRVDDKTINLSLTESSISPFNISGISVSEDNANFVLLKLGLIENLSGAVQGNQLTISYTYLGGAVTFTGTK
jgi:hypothetical protein